MRDRSNTLLCVCILCATFLILGIMAIGESNKEEVAEPVQQEQVAVEEEKEEQSVEDEYLTEKDIVKETNEEDQMILAKSILDEMAKESFGRDGYKILSEGNAIILYADIDRSEVASSTSTQWEGLRDTIAEVSIQVQDRMEDIGCGNINVALGVADVDRDEVYLMASNGVIVYDVFE